MFLLNSIPKIFPTSVYSGDTPPATYVGYFASSGDSSGASSVSDDTSAPLSNSTSGFSVSGANSDSSSVPSSSSGANSGSSVSSTSGPGISTLPTSIS